MARSDLIEALLWNKPELTNSGAPGAGQFIDAINFRRIDGEVIDGDPLSVAAHGILADATGESEEALVAYRQLQDGSDDLERLLGLCLLCWSEHDLDSDRISEARAVIEQLDIEQETRARLTAKLIASAFNFGWDDLLPDLFERALEWAPPHSMINVVLHQEAHNLLGSPLLKDWQHEVDGLTEYPWIRELIATSAQAALAASVEEAARSPWRLSFTIGAAPLNRPVAAEAQARWAGAIWLRRELQQQLAAHLLTGGAESSSQFASAVALWSLGGGTSIPQVIDATERHFDADSADFIIEALTRSNKVAHRFDQRLLEAAVECWDLVSDATAESLLERFEPIETEHPIWKLNSVLWSVLSLRIPQQWEARFESLTDESARAILTEMTPPVAENLPLGPAKRLYHLGTEDELPLEAMRSLVVLKNRLGHDRLLLPLNDLPNQELVQLAWQEPQSVGVDDLRRVVHDLTDGIRETLSEAREGRGAWGGENPFNTLASALAKRGEAPGETLNVLIEGATDSRVPRNHRYDCLKVLTAAVAYEAVSSDSLPVAIDEIPEGGAESIWAEYSPALIRAAKTELAMASGCIDAYLPPLLVLSRDPDARVRMDAIAAALLGRRHSEEAMLESVLVNGLFDSSASVTQRALSGLAERPPALVANQAALAERLNHLFQTGNRDIRKAVAKFAAIPSLPLSLAEISQELLVLAAEDRSYEVRSVAQESPTEP